MFAKIDFRDASQPTFFADLVRDLDEHAKLGIRGVKVWKDLGMYVRDAAGKRSPSTTRGSTRSGASVASCLCRC